MIVCSVPNSCGDPGEGNRCLKSIDVFLFVNKEMAMLSTGEKEEAHV